MASSTGATVTRGPDEPAHGGTTMVLHALEATFAQARAAEAPDAAPASGLRLLPSIGASVLPAADPAPPLASGVAGQERAFVGGGGALQRVVGGHREGCTGPARV